MTRYVAFLGSINVGGHRVTMERLRAEFEASGATAVSTFIASGNVLFTSAKKAPTLEKAIERHLGNRLGFPVTAFVRTAAEVIAAVERMPFGPIDAGDTQVVTFLRAAPTAAQKKATEALSNGTDTLLVRGAELHWRIHGGVSTSSIKASVLAKALGHSPTTRNVKSLTKLARLLASP